MGVEAGRSPRTGFVRLLGNNGIIWPRWFGRRTRRDADLTGRPYDMFKIMLHVFVLFQFSVDVTFPHFHDVVIFAFQVLDLCNGAVVKFLHGFAADRIHGIAGVTFCTTVPKTTVDFERGMRFFVVAVEQIVTFAFLATVACVLDIDFVLIGRVRQPFVRKHRLIVLGVISHRRNDADRISWRVVGAIHEMAGRGDGERSERIDVGNVVKQFAKLHTIPSANTDVGTTIRNDFFFKVEDVIAFLFRRVPCHERFFIFRIHSVRIVVGRRWDGTNIILFFFLVEDMRKVAFGEFFDTERFREIGEFHRNEIERVDEPNVK